MNWGAANKYTSQQSNEQRKQKKSHFNYNSVLLKTEVKRQTETMSLLGMLYRLRTLDITTMTLPFLFRSILENNCWLNFKQSSTFGMVSIRFVRRFSFFLIIFFHHNNEIRMKSLLNAAVRNVSFSDFFDIVSDFQFLDDAEMKCRRKANLN